MTDTGRRRADWHRAAAGWQSADWHRPAATSSQQKDPLWLRCRPTAGLRKPKIFWVIIFMTGISVVLSEWLVYDLTLKLMSRFNGWLIHCQYMSTSYSPHGLIKSVILHSIELNCKPHGFTIQRLAPLNQVGGVLPPQTRANIARNSPTARATGYSKVGRPRRFTKCNGL